MAWILLVLAGFFEIVWVVGLKYTESFTKLVPSAITIAAMLVSFWLLSFSLRTLPLGISYAIWTGIGTVGAVTFGILWMGESASLVKIACIALILIGMIGLKVSSDL